MATIGAVLAVLLKFLIVWLLGWLPISLLLVGVLGPVDNTPTWNSVGVAGGIIVAAVVCFPTARRTA